MKRNFMTLAAAVVAAGFLLTMGASRASADVLTFSLTSDHCSGGGCLGTASSAGTITVADISGGVTVDVALNSGFKFVNGGFPSSFGFNLAGNPTIAFSNVTTGFTPNGNTAGSLHMDGTGFFEYGLDCTGCGSGGSTPLAGPLDFTIKASGLTTASFEQNAIGQYFAVDVIGNGRTGAVDASNKTVPDGGMTLMLLGGVLVGFEALRRKLHV
jgi:hypothetical protein